MDSSRAISCSFGDFRLDAERRLLLNQDGSIVPLMPKAFDTLCYLVLHAGEVVDKDELMSAVWADTIVEENNLSQNISVLRKSLGERPGDHRYIVTVPGRGFKFVADVRPAGSATSGDESAVAAEAKPDSTGALSNRLIIAALMLAAVAIAAIVAAGYFSAKSTPSIDSVAVMPFVNESGDPELEYLTDGMTHALIDSLTTLQGLTIKPRSTVFRYKGRDVAAAAIGKELDVGAVMFGWVTKRGDDLTLRVELVDTRTENSLWSQTYNRKVSNLVVLEGELARNLVNGLRLKLSGADERKLARRDVKSGEAYQLYLNGQFHFRKLTPPAIAKSIASLQQAIAVDPSYALAHATLARAHIALALAAEAHPNELLTAKAAALRAIELDDELADGHGALAVTLALHDWNWAEAENQFRRALELDPSSAPTHQGYGDFLARMGRREEASEQMNRARELEPFSAFMNAFSAIAQKDADLATQRVKFAIELDPDFYLAHIIAAQIFVRQQRYPEAIEELRVAKELSPGQTLSDAMLAACLVRTGRTDEARAILDGLLTSAETRFVAPANIAAVHDALGQTDEALAMLEKAYEVRDPRLTFLKTQRVSDRLAQHPGYTDLMRRVGL